MATQQKIDETSPSTTRNAATLLDFRVQQESADVLDKCRSNTTTSNNDSGYYSPSPVALGIQSMTKTTKEIVDISQSSSDSPASLWTPIKTIADKPAKRSIFIPTNTIPSLTLASRPRTIVCQHQQKSSAKLTSSSGSGKAFVPKNRRFVSPHLIGHLVGRRRVDFVRELGTLNLTNLASDVLHLLEPHELHVCCQVSRTWRDTCLADPRNQKRLRLYLAQRAYEKENGAAARQRILHERPDHAPLMLLSEMQNSLGNPAVVVDDEPRIPKEMARFMRFAEEAKNLSKDQLLDKCPRCSSPARVDPSLERAECRSRNGCGLVYCIRCSCERGSQHVCVESPRPDPSPPPRGSTTTADSAAAQKSRQYRKAHARNNLRRLLS